MSLPGLLRHLLLPNTSNNHRARLLHPGPLALLVVLFLVLQVLGPRVLRFTPAVLGYASNIPPERIVELTNKEREASGLPRLNLDATLSQGALLKAGDMLARDYWAHSAPDGREPWAFFIESGYRYRFAGENLARDFGRPEDVVAAWMASPTHKENLLSPRYQDIGVAVVEGELGGVQTTLVVQFFGAKFVPPALAQGEVPATTASAATTLPATTESLSSRLSFAGKSLISPFTTTKRLAIFLAAMFLALLAADLVMVRQRNIVRHSSRTLAHMLFFGMILLALFAARPGVIL